MSNKIQLQTNNTNLDALITRINTAKDTAASLPDAGSGTNVETCTVIVSSPNDYSLISATQYINEAFVTHYSYAGNNNSSTISNVPCGSCVTIITPFNSFFEERNNATYVMDMKGCPVYSIDAPANGIASITIYSDD